MISNTTLALYDEIIQKQFPSVHVIPDTRFADEYGDSLCALGVPDEKRGEFAIFVLEELTTALDDAGVEFLGIMPYSQAEAEEIFPDACKQIWDEAPQSFLEHVLLDPVEPWSVSTSSTAGYECGIQPEMTASQAGRQ